MRITIETDSQTELESLIVLLKTLKIGTVRVVSGEDGDNTFSIKKGDKKIDPHSLFGIWANEPRSLESIRKDAWQRNISAD